MSSIAPWATRFLPVALVAGFTALPGAAAAQELFAPRPIEVHDIAAEAVDQTFRVQVAVPMSRPGSTDRYPVLYMTDVNGSMDALAGVVELMSFSGEMPPVIVVGIGYPVQSLTQTFLVRSRDLTPVADPQVGAQGVYADMIEGMLVPSSGGTGGGGADFLRFLHDELIPFIDSTYPTTDDRAYFGDSLGGLFGLFVLFERPETFDRYIIGSPSTWVGDEWIMERASTFVTENDDLPARVFMAAGGNEELGEALAPFRMVTNVWRLDSLLRGANFPGLRLQSYVFPDESHASVAYMNLIRGLHTVYDPASNAILEAVMKAMSEAERGSPR